MNRENLRRRKKEELVLEKKKKKKKKKKEGVCRLITYGMVECEHECDEEEHE
jgi:hypothetical protein